MKLVKLGVVMLEGYTKYQKSIIESENNDYAIVLENGIKVIHLKSTELGYVHGNSPPNYSKIMINTPNGFPTQNSGYRSEHESYLNPNDVVEVSLNPLLIPNTQWLIPPSPNITKAVWGPPGLFVGRVCPLAVLTNMGHVSVYECTNSVTEIADIPKFIYDDLLLKKQLHQLKRQDDFMEQLRDNCDALQSTGIGWCDRVSKKEMFETYFVTAQKNGQIYIWNVTSTKIFDTNIKFVLKHTFDSKIHNVNMIHWISLNGTRSILLLCNDQGLVEAFQLEIIANEFKILKRNVIWSEEDKMDVNIMRSFFWESDFLCLLFTKKSFVVSVVIDDKLNVKFSCFEYLGNVTITGFKMMQQNEFMISTLTGQIFKLNLRPNKFKKLMVYQHVEFDYDFTHWALYGFTTSSNNAFYILLISPCRAVDKICGKTSSKLVFCYDDSRNYLEELKSNKTMLLTDYWDTLDLAKLITFSSKTGTENWPTQFMEDMNVYRMKVCMWSQRSIKEIGNKPSELNEEMKKVILYEHVKKMLGYFVNLPIDYPLTDFQLKTISLYMKYINNYDGEISRKFPSDLMIKAIDLFEVKMSKVETICEFCGEDIKTIQCSKKHFRQWCCVTLQDITNNSKFLICPICGNLAHPDLVMESPLCTFCDVHFQKHVESTL